MSASLAWRYQKSNSQYTLSLQEQAFNPLEAEQIRIAMDACSINYRDLIALRNLAGRNVEARIPLSDGAGVVTEIGSGVKRWKVGDRVAGCFFPLWQDGRFELKHHRHDLGGTIDGMLAKHTTFHENGVVRVPDHLSLEQAATLPCAAVTAWQGLFERGGLKKGETVLVLGTGGVAIFALQLARAAGAQVIVTSRNPSKLEKVKDLGAWQTLDTSHTPDWSRRVWEMTEERGVDHIIETGGPGTLDQSMQAVSAGGQIHLIGVLTGFGPPQASLFPLLARNVTVHGIYVGSRKHFENLNAFLGEHTIEPVIDRVFSFEEALRAFEYLESAQHLGKIVIKVR